MSKVDEITKGVGLNFPSFGGGQGSDFNPIAATLKNRPFQFAAGVDIKSVVEFVLRESGHDDLVAACEIHQDCVTLRAGGCSNSMAGKIMTKYDLLSSDIEKLRDEKIAAAFAKVKKEI